MKLASTPEKWQEIDQYFQTHTAIHDYDHAQNLILKTSSTAQLKPIHVAPNQGKFLYLIAAFGQASQILEIGTLGGYSTLWLARALPKHGKLITLEKDPNAARIAREHFKHAGLDDKIELIEGDAMEILEKMTARHAQHFDLTFIDADKKNAAHYLRAAHHLTRVGGLIICDNVVRSGRISDFSQQDRDICGLRDYFSALKNNAALESTALQTVGEKGWDGLSISRVIHPPTNATV